MRNYRRQVNAQIFFEIAKRYQEMLQVFPVQDWTTRLNPNQPLPEPNAELKAGVLRYMATVHFAFTLHELRYLSKDLWRILQSEHRRTLTSPLFVREWRDLRVEFELFPGFSTYVESLQSSSNIVAPDSPIHSQRFRSCVSRFKTQSPPRGRDAHRESIDSEFPD